jgi:hypothetical protein
MVAGELADDGREVGSGARAGNRQAARNTAESSGMVGDPFQRCKGVIGGLCALHRRLGLLRHYLGAQLDVGCKYVAAAPMLPAAA